MKVEEFEKGMKYKDINGNVFTFSHLDSEKDPHFLDEGQGYLKIGDCIAFHWESHKDGWELVECVSR